MAKLHPNPDTGGPLVCTSCKGLRGDRYKWRLEGLLLGVCQPCRTWVVNNRPVIPAGQAQCDCSPDPWRFAVADADRRQSSVFPTAAPDAAVPNNDTEGELRIYHMCRRGIMAYWRVILLRARPELIACHRLEVRRRKANRSHFGKKATRAPEQRRRATTQRTGPRAAELEPKCYCGT